MVSTRGFTLHALVNQLDANNFLSWLTEKTGIKQLLEDKEKASHAYSNSKEVIKNSNQLIAHPASLRNPISILKGSASFLFIPIPFIDNGSFFLNLQSYESPIWYLFYLLLLIVIFGLIRGSVKPDFTTVVASLFSLLFIFESALVEVNDGTSVRHRSVLLIGILVAVVNQRRVKLKQANQGDGID